MATIWNFRKWLASERDIFTPSQLQTVLIERAGVKLSLQALSCLMKNHPSALRLQTMEAICNALECRLSDFFEVKPEPIQESLSGKNPVRLYGERNKLADGRRLYPDPAEYLPRQRVNSRAF